MNFLKFKMNKRGEEESSNTGAIIAAVIAAVVLVLVIIGLYLWFSGSGLPFASYLPGFNQTKPPVVDMEILRYRILQDKVQYYDGIKWNDFKDQGSVEMNGKTIYYYSRPDKNYQGIKLELLHNFISKSSRDPWPGQAVLLSAPKIASEKIAEPLPTWYRADDWVAYGLVNAWDAVFADSYPIDKGGDMRLAVKSGLLGPVVDIYVIHIDNSARKLVYKANGQFDKEESVLAPGHINLMNEAIAWRDSFLDKPTKVTYFDANNEPQVIYVCFNRDRYNIDKDLQVNLANPVAVDAKC